MISVMRYTRMQKLTKLTKLNLFTSRVVPYSGDSCLNFLCKKLNHR